MTRHSVVVKNIHTFMMEKNWARLEFTNYFGEKVIDFQDSNYHFLGSYAQRQVIVKKLL